MSDSTATMTVVPETETPERRKERRKAMASSFLGSTVEYYDFLLYASAAGLVFPQLFFSDLSPALGTTLSFVILLAGYIARPIGSIGFGYLGDRYGRKNVLIVTLIIMGLVSVAIGLLPSSQAIGPWAAIILVALRIIQGISVGGEWAGATLMSMEHAQEGKKGFGASIAIAGGPAGAVLATGVFALFAALAGDSFANPDQYFVTDWGWRLPFLFSALLVVVGLYLRVSVKESPEFEEARKAGKVQTVVPLGAIVKRYPRSLILGILAGVASLSVQGLQGAFLVPYIVQTSEINGTNISSSQALLTVTIGSIIAIFMMPLLATLSDILGRKTVLAIGGVAAIIGAWIFYSMVGTAAPVLVYIGLFFLVAFVQPAQYGPIGGFISEKFPTEMRYTGAGITFQIATILGAGTAPLVANQLVRPGESLVPLIIYISVLFLISTAAILASNEEAHKVRRAHKTSMPTEAPEKAPRWV